MSILNLFFLGLPKVENFGTQITFETRHALSLLIYLAVTNRNHQRDTLSTLLWPEKNQSQARQLLRSSLHTLRESLTGEWIIATRETVGMNPETDYWVDVHEFRNLIEGCSSHEHPLEGFVLNVSILSRKL